MTHGRRLSLPSTPESRESSTTSSSRAFFSDEPSLTRRAVTAAVAERAATLGVLTNTPEESLSSMSRRTSSVMTS